MPTVKHRQIAINTLAQLGGRFVSSALTFIATLILAAHLGVAGFGEYTTAVSFLALFYVAADLGMNPVFVSEAAGREKNKFAAFLGLRIAISSGLIIIAISVIWFLAKINGGYGPGVVGGVIAGSASILAYALYISATALFQIQSRYDKAAAAQILGSLTATLLLLVYVGRGTAGVISGVLVVWTIGMTVTAGIALYLSRGGRDIIKIAVNPTRWRQIITTSLPVGLTLIFNMIYLRLGVLILSAYRPSGDVGAYGLAYKFFEFALAVPAFFVNSVYPDLVGAKTIAILRHRLGLSFVTLLILSLVVGSGFWVLAPLLGAVRGNFDRAVPLLRALTLFLPAFFLTSPLMGAFIILKKQQQLAAIYGIVAVISILSSFWLIGKWGALGVVLLTGAAEIAVLVIGGGLLLNYLQEK